MFGNWLFNRSAPAAQTSTYFERNALLQQFHAALQTRKHVVVFGETKHGKSALLREAFGAKPAVTITAFPDIKFADIFRTYLMTLGCSITVESTRKKSIGSKVDVKFPWPPLLPSASVEGQYEGSVTTHNFTADINSANDICYLLRQMRSTTPLVIDHFEQLGRNQRSLLIDALPMMFETGMPQIALVATTADLPFDYNEQNRLASCILPVAVPPLSRAESDKLIDREFARRNGVAPAPAKEILYATFDGAIGPILDACALVAEDNVSTDEQIRTAIHEQTRRTFLAFLSAIVDREWTFSVSVEKTVAAGAATDAAPTAPDATVAPPDDAVPIDATLAGDAVFARLQQSIGAPGDEATDIPEATQSLLSLATDFGRQLLVHNTAAEPARFVAFALYHFIESPLELTNWQYSPADEAETADINLGALICALLLEGDAANPILLTRQTLTDFFDRSGYVLRTDLDRTFTKMLKRIRRLGRRLRVDPSLFAVSDDLKSCTLWDERSSKLFGDVRPQVKTLLDQIVDGDDDG